MVFNHLSIGKRQVTPVKRDCPGDSIVSVGMAVFPFLKAFMHSFLGYVACKTPSSLTNFFASVFACGLHMHPFLLEVVVNRLVVDSMSCQSSK